MSLFNFATSEADQGILSAVDDSFAIISFQANGTIINANENFLNTVGYTLNEIVGNHHKMFCDSSYTNTREYTDFWNDLASGKTQTDEFKRIKKDGTSVWIQASYTPVKNSSGQVTRVVKIASDITEQKLKNADFEGQLDAIGKSYAVIEFNMQGIITKVNDNFLNTLGFSESDIMGKHHSMFCEESYKNSNEYTQFWRKLNDGNFDSGEYLRLGKGGKEIWIQASYNPIYDIDGKPYKVVKYAQDITARKNMVFSVENTSKELTTSAKELFTTAEAMSSSSSSTTAETEEVSVAIEEISQGTQNVSDKIDTMLSSIKEISISSKSAKTIANDAQIKSQETTKSIKKLDEESKNIGEVVKSIAQIAFQTNILSLNAAVEAATAGEAGKGYAVVAQEVRNLATRSDESAKEITDGINKIQELVKVSSVSIQSIDETISKMSEISENIVQAVNNQGVISSEVSTIMNETSIGVNSISETMQNVARNASISGEESSKTLNSATKLNNLSTNLSKVLESV